MAEKKTVVPAKKEGGVSTTNSSGKNSDKKPGKKKIVFANTETKKEPSAVKKAAAVSATEVRPGPEENGLFKMSADGPGVADFAAKLPSQAQRLRANKKTVAAEAPAAPKKAASAQAHTRQEKAASSAETQLINKKSASTMGAQAAREKDSAAPGLAEERGAASRQAAAAGAYWNADGTGSPLTRQEIFQAWWKAARPPFYIATLVPLFLGYFAARNDQGSPSGLVFLGVLLVGFLLHLCANLANDLFDYQLGTDRSDTIGGSRGLQQGAITVSRLKLVLLGGYSLAALFTLLGVWITSLWGLFFIALFGALCSYYYVAPPIMYGYRALGEFFVFICMGLFMVGGSYYALTGSLPAYVLALSLPVGLGVAGILYYQSLPEIESDAAAGKKTLAGLLGPVRAVFLYKLWWPGVWFLVVTLYLAGLTAWPALLGIILGIPLYLKACRRLDDFGGDWFSLDQYGNYTRAMYMSMGLFLLLGVAIS